MLNLEILELIELIDLIIIDVRNIFLFIFVYIIDNNIPGPNAYKEESLIGCKIFNSRYKSPCFISCSNKYKIIDRKAAYPGPGSYIRFSEFGILAPKKNKDKEKKEETEKQKENENNEGENENTPQDKEEKNVGNEHTNQENNETNQNKKENNETNQPNDKENNNNEEKKRIIKN